jgi:hypothetical protein
MPLLATKFCHYSDMISVASPYLIVGWNYARGDSVDLGGLLQSEEFEF